MSDVDDVQAAIEALRRESYRLQLDALDRLPSSVRIRVAAMISAADVCIESAADAVASIAAVDPVAVRDADQSEQAQQRAPILGCERRIGPNVILEG